MVVLGREGFKAIMKVSHFLLRLIGARDQNCPDEVDVLAYSEGKLSTRVRAQLERHFAHCDDCRQVLAFLARESEKASDPLTEEAVSEQTDRVLAYIQRDDLNTRRPAQKVQPAAGFYVSFPRLASAGLVICAVAFAGIFMITRDQSPANAAMDALRLGLKNGRHTEARISGGFEHSRYLGTTRGGDSNDDDLHFNRAENKVKAAAIDSTAVEARQTLARVYLARGTPEDAGRALVILDQLMNSGAATPEALNDIGVAHLQLEHYDKAIGDFSQALAKSPGYNEALFNRALAEGLARHDEDARRDWQQFINQSSDENWKAEAKEHLNRQSSPANN